ncbi:mitochondrial carrier [Fistulina hepatica ATCC 64428]|uniref:Mitochondrial carrier n=1 Tax=Fistulina hepatica ATCC 64428 TaxID=1128425 RepID=A0A0D7A2S4_9AGAR|nr:mitochondrial carrier [Fistulina hepatica ATCC 64428]
MVADGGAHSESLSVREAVRDITLGSLAGMVSELFCYPFDLAKTRLQAQLLSPSSSMMPFKGPWDCLRQTFLDEGVRGLYRGLTVPVAGSMAETSAIFLSYTYFQNTIGAISNYHSGAPLSITQLGLAASGAGFVTSFILTPIELVKCRMQVQMMNGPSSPRVPPFVVPPDLNPTPRTPIKAPQRTHYLRTSPTIIPGFEAIRTFEPKHIQTRNLSSSALPGPFSIVASIVRTQGFQGLWVGHLGTLLRETFGTAAWFVSKEYVGRKLVERRTLPTLGGGGGSVDDKLLPWESAVAGAIGGATCVLTMYPIDTVKSAMQTEDELQFLTSAQSKASRRSALGVPTRSELAPTLDSARRTFYGMLRQMYRTHGLRGLYAGCGMTVAQAAPSSAIVFLVYDGLSGWFT